MEEKFEVQGSITGRSTSTEPYMVEVDRSYTRLSLAQVVEEMSKMAATELEEAFQALEDIEKAGNARLPKIEILKKNQGNVQLKEIFGFTYNWQLNYGVSAPGKKTLTVDPAPAGWKAFTSILAELYRRNLTGDGARRSLRNVLCRLTEREQKWALRILNRDLQIRVSVGTVEKIWPGLIPKFDIQLAETYEEGTALKFPLIVEPKLDGMRVLIFFKGGKATAYSRGAKEIPSLQFICDDLAKKIGNTDFALDCEAYVDSGWNETASLVRTHPDNMTAQQLEDLKKKVVLYVFDNCYYEASGGIYNNHPYSHRREIVSDLVVEVNHPNVKWIVGEEVNSIEQIQEAYDAFLGMGFEGIMIKDPGAPYKAERSANWLKYKPELDMDVEIVSLHEGQSPNTIGKLGQVKVRTKEGTEFYVGSGFTFEQRDEFWNSRDQMVGKILEIKTQKDAVNVAKARFPIFKRLRTDRSPFEFSGAESKASEIDAMKGELK